MDHTRKLIFFWFILAVLLVGGLVLASKTGSFEQTKFGAGDVLKLLGMFFVLALFVERTIEVFITAWRGEKTVQGQSDLEAAKQALAKQPADTSLQAAVKDRADWLAQYKCETKDIALRSALVLGILIAAVGVRSFHIFVTGSLTPSPVASWANTQSITFQVLDVLISGGIIGGGSEAIHKMMNVITEFFDATTKKVQNT